MQKLKMIKATNNLNWVPVLKSYITIMITQNIKPNMANFLVHSLGL